ncbi:hypothetical protein TCELL_1016 [Thermogladius calderae 1633]|uniref:Uncharacterized protein n=1 Tax=Thermogladius calderae (strain DSM 22663 / VKM B-2946 / 1633) TaxID=1184251 RepID=I3TFA1_THEC1|nr:hypothetical protein [Thermogladius calderae]AFK51439.1 hypothetical protein TCELL_1016 [Thermogladius calderae 1633]
MSTTSIIDVQILGERSIGRYFQAAAIGAVYDKLPSHTKSEILNGFETGVARLSVTDFDTLCREVAAFLNTNVCDVKRSRPSLYKAGNTSDKQIIANAGIDITGKDFCSALVDFYQNGGLVNNAAITTSVPMLLRTYVFSAYKEGVLASKEKINVGSLYLALAGSVISITGKVTKIVGGERKIYDLFLVPDASAASLSAAPLMYSLMHVGAVVRQKVGGTPSIESYLRHASQVESLSLELAVLLAFTMLAYDAYKTYNLISSASILYDKPEAFRLINITGAGQQRPQVVWERPLTLTHVLSMLDSKGALALVKYLDKAIGHLKNLAGKIENLDSIIASCIEDLFAYVETSFIDALASCGSRLARVYDKLYLECAKDDKVACSAVNDYASLLKLLSKLA